MCGCSVGACGICGPALNPTPRNPKPLNPFKPCESLWFFVAALRSVGILEGRYGLVRTCLLPSWGTHSQTMNYFLKLSRSLQVRGFGI